MEIKFIGTSHISKDSIKEVKDGIEEFKPDIVCLELDKQRFLSINNKKSKISLKLIRKIGVKGFLFLIIASWGEKYLGGKVGTKPGDEMREAIKISIEKKLKLALVDRPIEITLKRISQSFGFKEKIRFFLEMFKPRKIPFKLEEVPSERVIESLIEEMREKFPSLFKVLIDERNEYIIKKMKFLIEKFPESRFLVILGAGHVKEVKKRLKDVDSKDLNSHIMNKDCDFKDNKI